MAAMTTTSPGFAHNSVTSRLPLWQNQRRFVRLGAAGSVAAEHASAFGAGAVRRETNSGSTLFGKSVLMACV